MSNPPTPQHFEPVPLTIEQATHLFKHLCKTDDLADLQDGVDAFIAVMIEIDGLDYFISRQAKDELMIIASALHTITDEPTVHFENEEFRIVVPALSIHNAPPSPDNDDLSWLDRILPSE